MDAEVISYKELKVVVNNRYIYCEHVCYEPLNFGLEKYKYICIRFKKHIRNIKKYQEPNTSPSAPHVLDTYCNINAVKLMKVTKVNVTNNQKLNIREGLNVKG